MRRRLQVVSGRPVRVEARVLGDQPLRQAEERYVYDRRDDRAWQWFRRHRRGVNLNNGWEAPPGQDWGATYTSNDMPTIANQGFDHIRIPVAWHFRTNAQGRIKTAFWQKIDRLVESALEHELGVIIVWHHYHAFMRSPSMHRAPFHRIWRDLARRWKGKAPDRLVFELLNEPYRAAESRFLNRIYKDAIETIRAVDPKRLIMLDSGGWANPWELRSLRVPRSFSNLLVSAHMYEPFLFTHQGAPWTFPRTRTTGITYPGPPEEPIDPHPKSTNQNHVVRWFRQYNRLPQSVNPAGPRAFIHHLQVAKNWMQRFGRPVYIGEFGTFREIPADDRARYLRDVRQALESRSLSWALWGWSANFGYWDDEKEAPRPGLRHALFGP